MLKRLTAAALILAATTIAAAAAGVAAYTGDAFDAARKAGKGVIVHIHAPWCPTCRAQAPVIDKLAASPDFKDVVVLRVDYDSQPDAKTALDARNQSTIIVFKGEKEVGRAVGATDPGAITDIARKAL